MHVAGYSRTAGRRAQLRSLNERHGGAALHYIFFSGKGGVGKTTCSVTAAVQLAQAGHAVLLVSTDPAHSLGHALAMRLSSRPVRVPLRGARLFALELDADRALQAWLHRRKQALHILAERGTYLDSDDVEQLLQLSMPGVDETMGLLELRRLAEAGDPERRPYDCVVVDTAPTGHTLRLLSTPELLERVGCVFDGMLAKHRFLSESLGGVYRTDSGDELAAELQREGEELIALLRDPNRCGFYWVLLPEELSLQEAADGVSALAKRGIPLRQILVNRVKRGPPNACLYSRRRIASESAVMDRIRAAFPRVPVRLVAELDNEPRGSVFFSNTGIRKRRQNSLDRPLSFSLGSALGPAKRTPRQKPQAAAPFNISVQLSEARRPAAWLDVFAPPGCRLLLFAGKGGVGKTSCAAATALEMARHNPQSPILLLSTDPAHSLGDVLQMRVGDQPQSLPELPSLHVREIDAERLFRARRETYVEGVDQIFDTLQGRSGFDAAYDRSVAKDLLELCPPGLDELFGILSVRDALFPEQVAQEYHAVVVDTAPTGHALRLLEMPQSALGWIHALLALLLKYKDATGLGNLAADLLKLSRELRHLAELLRDETQTRIVAVTRPAQLPALETAALLGRLRKMHLKISAILMNDMTPPDCIACRRVAKRERRYVDELPARVPRVLAPAVAPPPQGAAELLRWSASWEPGR